MVALTILFAQAQCQADFSYMQNGPTTIFTDLSTINSAWSTNYSVTWDWDLGDGNASTQQNPTHTYANNGIYWVCLIVTYFDSTTINSCTSFYCDSIFVGNSIPASWDCNPNSGCYNPGTGLGQYTSLAACQAMCGNPTPSWDCPVNTLGGCYDPGTGLGQYSSLSACQAVCQSQIVSPCDSIEVVGSQSQLTMQVISGINTNSPLYMVTTDPNGYIIGEDSLTWTHDAWPIMALTDSIITCITYVNGVDTLTCCVEFFWNGSFWAKIGSITSVGEIVSFDKKLIKVVDVLGRKTSINMNQTLFFIYEDGTIEKRYIIDRK
tara:strand:+ start:1234 stop:2196 length:963 start_codon:yes stop_codon:yes gene_type:complete